MNDVAKHLRETPADAEHDANCSHFQEAAWLARAALDQDEHIVRLERVAWCARELLSLPEQSPDVGKAESALEDALEAVDPPDSAEVSEG